MVNDLWTSIKANLYERTTSPLFGALALAWVAWNYRLVFVLFSTEPVLNKFTLIDEVLYPSIQARLTFLVVFPVLTAVLALLVYPHPARWVYGYWRKRQRELKALRQKIDEETPLTLEESKRLRAQLVRLRGEYERQLREASEESEQLRDVIAREQNAGAELRQELDKLRRPDNHDQYVPSGDQMTTASEIERHHLLEEQITHESLVRYTALRYPELEVSDDLTQKVLAEIDRKRFRTIRDIHRVVESAESAVRAYAAEKPDLFKFGTDWITKSLGFVDHDFRVRHGFSAATKAAFKKYGHQVAAHHDGPIAS